MSRRLSPILSKAFFDQRVGARLAGVDERRAVFVGPQVGLIPPQQELVQIRAYFTMWNRLSAARLRKRTTATPWPQPMSATYAPASSRSCMPSRDPLARQMVAVVHSEEELRNLEARGVLLAPGDPLTRWSGGVPR